MHLTPEVVADIHKRGGTILGTSRGDQDPEEMVDDPRAAGHHHPVRRSAATAPCAAPRRSPTRPRPAGCGSRSSACRRRSTTTSRTSTTASASRPPSRAATESIRAAHTEAASTPNGVGLVKLMGRHSGFIACYAALANHDVDFVLIPEVPFALDGDGRLPDGTCATGSTEHGHAVVVVAEGAGQELLAEQRRHATPRATPSSPTSASCCATGSSPTSPRAGAELNLRYVDPGYAIRSVPANPYDAVFCLRLAQAAVHAAMAGRTAMVVGRWHGRFVHVPIALATGSRNQVDPDGDLWMSVLEATGQPPSFGRAAVSLPAELAASAIGT